MTTAPATDGPATYFVQGDDYEARVVDLTDTLQSARTVGVGVSSVPVDDALLETTDGGSALVIGWLAIPCEATPTVLLSHESDLLKVDIYEGPWKSSMCHDMGVPRKLVLDFERDWRTDEVVVSIHDGSPPP